MTQSYDLSITRTIRAKRKDVYKAWLTAEALAAFMLPGEGMTVPKAETDPTVGGKFLIVMKAGDTELPHSGEYKALEEPQKISFTWVSPHSPSPSLVTIDLQETSENETELTLTHTGLPTEESRDNHKSGWGRIVDTLARYMA